MKSRRQGITFRYFMEKARPFRILKHIKTEILKKALKRIKHNGKSLEEQIRKTTLERNKKFLRKFERSKFMIMERQKIKR